MKCGTTSLSVELDLHPEVGFCKGKESDFFLRADWRDHLDEYHSLFTEGEQTKVLGEGSPNYTKLPHISPASLADDLYEYNSEMKLIYMMREPVKRLISHYKHSLRSTDSIPDFEELMWKEKAYIEVGRYAYQLAPFTKRFQRNQILLISLEEYQADRTLLLERVANFIGVNPSKFPAQGIHLGDSSRQPNKQTTDLITSGPIQKLKRLVPEKYRHSLRETLIKTLTKKEQAKPIEISESLQQHLDATYKLELEEIEALKKSNPF